MERHNTLRLDATVFDPAIVTDETKAFNQEIMDMMAKTPSWHEVGAERYRAMRTAGETPVPKPRYLESAEQRSLQSRDEGRSIPCRVLKPRNGKPGRATFLHIHGGGWVLQDEKSQDPFLQDIADTTHVVVVSVGYRLAPEHPFPAAPEDCYDVAEWLVDNAESEFGAALGFVSGESAGAHLAMLVALHMLQSDIPRYRDFCLRGLILHFGCFSLSWAPQLYHFQKPKKLLLDRELMDSCVDVFLPGWTDEQKKHPTVSPLYTDLGALRGKLPPALFTCGTEDCLLDDTMFMSIKYLMADGEAVVKIIPGAPHGYIGFPRHIKATGAADGFQAMEDFILLKLDAWTGQLAPERDNLDVGLF